ncbi:MAG: hypothetical protein WAZ18_03820 [Alphaproteobacteria bacterium]
MKHLQTVAAALGLTAISTMALAQQPSCPQLASAIREAQAKIIQLQGKSDPSSKDQLKDWTIQLKTLNGMANSSKCPTN